MLQEARSEKESLARKKARGKKKEFLFRDRAAEGKTQRLIYQFNESGNDRNNWGAASPLKSIAWRFMAH